MDTTGRRVEPIGGRDLIRTDTRCVDCGYNLRGLNETGRCPECGREIRLSLFRHTLGQSSVGWMRGLFWGAVLLLAGAGMNVFSYVLAPTVDNPSQLVWVIAGAGIHGNRLWVQWFDAATGHVEMGCVMGAAIGLLLHGTGVLLLTRAGPMDRAWTAMRGARRGLRIVLGIEVMAGVATCVCLWNGGIVPVIELGVSVALVGLNLVEGWLLFRRLRNLASRIPSNPQRIASGALMWIVPSMDALWGLVCVSMFFPHSISLAGWIFHYTIAVQGLLAIAAVIVCIGFCRRFRDSLDQVRAYTLYA